MFKFFNSRKWFLWAWAGSATILLSLWVQVQIDVKINEWFGTFYDMIQTALADQIPLRSRNTGVIFYHL